MSGSIVGAPYGFFWSVSIHSMRPTKHYHTTNKKAMTIWQKSNSTTGLFLSCIALGVLFLVYAFYKFGNSVNLKRGNQIYQSLHSFLVNDLKFSHVGFNINDSKNL
ncbi:AIF_collapsed_G0031830.mRNA.1.CDS.1 [Saccharomyces cerevisiae]|nr:AIF_collapsed_G0031830.mRNA.1.CDS.1 [Saccharomyces cerevisiae]